MGIYQSLYDLINTYIFGSGIVAGSVHELATVLLSLTGCIFLLSLPFVLVFKIIRLFF